MPPQRRKHGNRHLPDNLYRFRARGRWYYQYRDPTTGEKTGLGYDEKAAIRAAQQANEVLDPANRLLFKIQDKGSRTTLAEYAQHYRDEILPGRRINGEPLSPAYLRETGRILAAILRGLKGGHQPVNRYTQQDLADYLNTIQSPDAFNQHRVRLIMLWKHMVSDGLVTENLPERILPRDKSKRLRERLTLEAYNAIFDAATPAIRHAMEISLNSLQRRADVQKWRYDDQRDGFAHVVQQKTRKHGPSAHLAIPLDLPAVHSRLGARTLGELIEATRDGVLCPFLIHQRPERVRKSAEKDHPFQLSCKQISDGFAAAREASGIFEGVPPERRPTFHELISLGADLRREAGWSRQDVQRLKGHTSAAMTDHYLEGHRWTVVEVPNG